MNPVITFFAGLAIGATFVAVLFTIVISLIKNNGGE